MTMLYDELPDYDRDYKEKIFDRVREQFKDFKEILPFNIDKMEFSDEERKFCITCANELPDFLEHVLLYSLAACRECRKHTPNAWCDDCTMLEILQHTEYLGQKLGLERRETEGLF